MIAGDAASKLPAAAERKVDFVRDVQPILAQNCYGCHGPRKQESQLRWDNRKIAFQGGEHGTPILPGKSADSLIIRLVAGLDPENVMPKKGKRLTDEQVGVLRAWIDQGAVWPESASVKVSDPRDHWAFKRPVRPAVPVVKNKAWPRNPIDNFILARLDKENLLPSAAADKQTLIRRLSLDLTGLPPTLEEIDAFVTDNRPDAYERLVKRLMDSPHYGECWARHWLDVAKYADSNGYEKDLARSIWPYRDWVINAFNANMPFDEFAVEQVAGDLLPNSTLEQKVATGFFRNSMLNEEGGVDPEQFRNEAIIERMDVLGKTFLGLTVNCCQCHNHKFDPIAQKEYYRLFAFLNNDDEPEMEVPNKDQQAQRERIREKIAEIEDRTMASAPNLRERTDAWEAADRKLLRDWVTLKPASYFGAVGTKFTALTDDSLLATASSPPTSEYTINARTDLKGTTGFRLEALTDPNLPNYGPGRAENGNFVLTHFKAEVVSENSTNEISLQNATADFSQKGFPVTAAIGPEPTNKATGWATEDLPGRRNQDRQAVFETKEPLTNDGPITLRFTLTQSFGQQHTIGRLRLSATAGPLPLRADPLSKHARQILAVEPGRRTPEQRRELFNYYRLTDTNFASANKEIDEEQSKWPVAPKTWVLLARTELRQTHIFQRGDWQKPGDLVTPGTPSIMHPMAPGAPANRLGLARWLVDKKNPTLARVTVNRIWQEFFGRGLVATAEDLGTQGDRPTHPELLDWLAVEFMDHNWDVKHIQQLIVESAAYRQSSAITPHLWETDQYNQWLARGPRFRVDGEIIRDIALSAAGLLNEEVGGPSVYPPIPDGVLSLGYGSPMKWENKDKAEGYRRALYTFEKRSVPYPSLQVFDAPTGESSCPRRTRSNTPLQALTTLNDPVFFEAAQAMALRVWKNGGASEPAKIDYAFRLCTGRKPRAEEAATVAALLDEQSKYFEDHTTKAVRVASHDVKSPPEDVNLHKVAAWTVVARVLLNMDETITKE